MSRENDRQLLRFHAAVYVAHEQPVAQSLVLLAYVLRMLFTVFA